jgi:hypothetical protein
MNQPVNPAADADMNQQVQSLRVQLQAAEEKLAGLQADLRVVKTEWDAVADKRAQYEALEHACQSLEKLREQGLSRVFWGDRASDAEVAAHVVDVRARVADVAAEVVAVESRYQASRRVVEDQIDAVTYIEDALEEATEAVERRRQEWVVEREETALPWRLQVMPWARRQEDDQRFYRTLLGSAAVCLLLAILLPMIDIPLLQREEVVEVPERLARLIRKEPLRPMPETPPQVREEQVAKKPQDVEPERKPEVVPEVVPEAAPEAQVASAPSPAPKPASAKERMASTGLLAFRESFSNLASSRPSARLGSDARISSAGETATGLPSRSMVAKSGPGSSGGINLSDLSRDVGDGGGGGEQIAGVALSRVASSIGGNGTGGGSDRPVATGGIAGRTDEEIQIVFDRYKAALYRLYNRELRNDPTLRGQMVLRLTIEPDGTVSFCKLEASDMGAPMLADQVVQRILGFDFGAKDVPPVTILYPIDFLPTA